MHVRLRLQLAEALGADNRWFCSQAHGKPIDDPEILLVYFIRSGGAANFAARFQQATGALNRWYCSEFYGQDVRDEETLWEYFHRRRACTTSSISRQHATTC